MKKVLVLEDEKSIRDFVVLNLSRAGYDIVEADTGERALELFDATPDIDIAVLDVMLPGIDGFEVCKSIRASNQKVGIIMLTAKVEDIDKILGLEYGADDYVTKPFNIREVTARIKAIMRRVNPTPKGDKERVIISGDIVLDYNFRLVKVRDKKVELTGKEFDLLELFLKNPGKVYTRDNLLDIAWGFDYPGDVRTVDVHVRRLREKIEENPAEPKYIKTKWGVGYYYKKD